jgi:hypothetical protein
MVAHQSNIRYFLKHAHKVPNGYKIMSAQTLARRWKYKGMRTAQVIRIFKERDEDAIRSRDVYYSIELLSHLRAYNLELKKGDYQWLNEVNNEADLEETLRVQEQALDDEYSNE